MDKKLIILDLDETLIHSSMLVEKMGNEFDFMVDNYFVYKRPYVDMFLNYCKNNFQVAIWSSGSEDYVTYITSKLFNKPEELNFVWSRKRCTLKVSEGYSFSEFTNEPLLLKNLKKVKKKGFDLKHVIVIDDSFKCHIKNYGNLIHVSSFEGDPQDRELLNLMKYLDILINEPNIRAIEKRGWRNKFKDD